MPMLRHPPPYFPAPPPGRCLPLSDKLQLESGLSVATEVAGPLHLAGELSAFTVLLFCCLVCCFSRGE